MLSCPKLTWLGSLWLLVSCDYPHPPRFVKEPLRGDLSRVRWVDSTHALQLVTRRESTGFTTEDKFVCMEKFRAVPGDSAYILNTYLPDNTYSRTTYVRGDTLYIYQEDESRLGGWVELTAGVAQDVGYKMKAQECLTDQLYGGAYQYDAGQDMLRKVATEATSFLEQIDDAPDGVYYVPFPGAGLRAKLHLPSLAAQLHQNW